MLYITRFKTVNFLHYFSKATRGPSLGTTSWEQAGMCDGESGKVSSERAGKCGFEDMAGKCGRGARESAPVDRAAKCGFGDTTGQCASVLKPTIRVLQNPKWRPIACLNYRVFSDNLRN